MGGDADPFARLASLKTVLGDAARLAEDVAGDAVLTRLLAAFAAMPAEDRAVIVDVIEREVDARVLSRATEHVTGQAARPNPNARLYVRSHGREISRSELEEGEMMLATLRALRVAGLLAIPEIHAEWLAATRAALAQVDAATRAVVETLVREILGLLAEANAAVEARTGD